MSDCSAMWSYHVRVNKVGRAVESLGGKAGAATDSGSETE